jgi:hypothetical protein
MPINTGNNLSSWCTFLLGVCLLMGACRSPADVPSGILPLNAMKELMWDVAQAEAYANQITSRDSSKNLKTVTLNLYQQVFSVHKTDKEQFASSVKYYELHPETNRILLDSLLQYATRQKDTLTSRSFRKLTPSR